VDARVLDAEARDEAWQARGRLGRGAFPETAAVMKWVVLPAQLADVMEQGAAVALRAGLTAAMAAHAGVGVVEAVLAGGEGAGAAKVSDVLIEWRALVSAAGGQALVESAPLAIKERVPVWDDPGPALRIMQRIKSQLDPSGLLNPGRFVGGL
jgi:glycolate oxidase FAD binding subunit